MSITAKTKLCMIIGDPVEHSLSPLLHNAGYQELGIADQFVYVGCRVQPHDIKDFVAGVRAMRVRGVGCTSPHKILVMEHLDKIDPIAQKIGAVNTIVNDDGVLTGYNTDWLGASLPLENVTQLQGKTVALLGAGGAARAIAYGVVNKGAELAIFNRTIEKAQALAEAFGGTAHKLDDQTAIRQADIIINATSLPDAIPASCLRPEHIVFDIVYKPYETQLIQDAQACGATVIHGTEMLLYQGLEQFKLFTEQQAPEQVLRQTLLEAIGGDK